MKKFTVLCLLVMAAACSNPQKKAENQAKIDIQEYLEKNQSEIGPFTVTEIIQMDSAYSPFMDLQALYLAETEYYSDLVKRHKDMLNTANDNLFMLQKIAALKEFDRAEEYMEFKSALLKSMEEPFSSEHEKNRIGVHAKYRIGSGKEIDSYFYYNTKDAGIGHSHDELFNLYGEISDVDKKIRDIQDAIIELK